MNKKYKSLFIDDLPILQFKPTKSNVELLEKIKSKFSNYDSYYVVSGCVQDRREIFEKLYKPFFKYSDRTFLQGVKIQFHQRTWEMYIANIFIKNSKKIESLNEGPDVIINEKIYIECTAPTKGKKGNKYKVPDIIYGRGQSIPEDKMILRITQSIEEKHRKYNDLWSKKKWFNSKSPFIIAINTGEFDFIQNTGFSIILKVLFGIGDQTISFDITNGSRSLGWSHRDYVEKGVSKIPITYFLNNKYSKISAIIFSSNSVLNHPDNIGKDCIIVHNPFAENKINETEFNFFEQWKNKGNKIVKI